jgi:KDO2-lipid IV(A) lauroyltransferase
MTRSSGALTALMRSAALVRDLAVTVILLLVVILPLWLLPWRAAASLGRWYGYLASFAWPEAQRAGMINFRRAFGSSMTRPLARRRTRAVFANLGAGIAEGIQFSRRFRSPASAWETVCEIEDPALDARVRADPRPKIFVTGHFGSWEIATAIAGLRVGARGAAVVRRVDNPFLNQVVRWVRLREPSQWIEKRGASIESLSRLRAGDSVAFLIDENNGPKGVFVDFFGRAASTTRTPALLSLMTGAPIVLGAAIRRPGNARLLYKLAIFEPSAVGGDPTAAVHELTRRVVATYQRWVAGDPLQWRWIHWRWKTRPDGSEETYRRADLNDAFSTRSAGGCEPAPLHDARS